MKRSRKPPTSEYSVGYKKPPIDHRFQPGNREHLKRSKIGKNPEGKLYRKVIGTSVKISHGRTSSYASRIQVLVDNFIAAAVRGDVGAAAILLQMHARSKEIGDMASIILVFEAADARL
jgi:hypothetical protein